MLKHKVTLKGEEYDVSEEKDFTINEDDINGELCRAGAILAFYANLAADLKAQSQTFKSRIELVESEASQKIRAEAIRTGNKLTEGGIRERVVVDPERIKALEEYNIAERDSLKAEYLFKTQQKKLDCLIALTYKHKAEISTY